jgi:multiple sugar transport system permease protein
MMAAALTGVLPVMIIFLFLQKYLVAGLTAGAVKE